MRHTRLQLESLEGRLVPAPAVVPVWPDPAHLTHSFVPDGTPVAGGASNLFAALGAKDPSAWQEAILRAYQTWAFRANLNIGVVADSGAPLGAPGVVQGDPRFGDIRVAARALPTTAVATTAYFQPDGTSWSGDLILNSNYSFGSGRGRYDLYSVVLHEAGLAFGLRDGADPHSVMCDRYRGVWGDLPAGDVRAIQALYGARTPDGGDRHRGNDTLATAAALRHPKDDPGAPLTTAAELSARGDVDWYRFRIDSDPHPNGVTVELQTSQLSLLRARLTVYGADGVAEAAAAAADPLHGDLTVRLAAVRPYETHYVKVEAAGDDVFGVGAYRLTVDLHPGADVGPRALARSRDLGRLGGAAGPGLTAAGSVGAGGGTSVYRFQTRPGDFPGGVTVALRSWGVSLVRPSVLVYDAAGAVLAKATTADPFGGDVRLHLGVAGGATYFVKVEGGVRQAFGVGAYRLTVEAGSPAAAAGPVLLVADKHPNGTFDAATALAPLGGFAGRSRDAALGALGGPADVDFFRVRSADAAQGSVMTVTVLAQDGWGLSPVLTAYDARRNLVQGTVLSNAGGVFVLQVAGVAAGADYFLAVSAGAGGGGVGNYYLGVGFSQAAADPLQSFAGGTLTAEAPQQVRTLTLAQDQLFLFELSADAGGSPPAAQVQMYLYDQAGNLLALLVSNAGQPPRTLAVYLGAGTYAVRLVAVARAAGSLPALAFILRGDSLSDPIGPMLIDPTASPTPSNAATPTLTDPSQPDPYVPPPATYFWSGASDLPSGVADPTSLPFYLF
jgi:hypothetical protein